MDLKDLDQFKKDLIDELEKQVQHERQMIKAMRWIAGITIISFSLIAFILK